MLSQSQFPQTQFSFIKYSINTYCIVIQDYIFDLRQRHGICTVILFTSQMPQPRQMLDTDSNPVVCNEPFHHCLCLHTVIISSDHIYVTILSLTNSLLTLPLCLAQNVLPQQVTCDSWVL